jgi:hypothetical protein
MSDVMRSAPSAPSADDRAGSTEVPASTCPRVPHPRVDGSYCSLVDRYGRSSTVSSFCHETRVSLTSRSLYFWLNYSTDGDCAREFADLPDNMLPNGALKGDSTRTRTSRLVFQGHNL